jgi:ribose/xylose/arabinose/galactoside ABC-type transport system permease subunit
MWMIVIGVIMWTLMHRSLFGFRLAAIGGNPVAARIVRVPIHRYKIIVFAISGVCAAFAGIMDFSFVGTTDPTGGTSLPFTVFAAVIIGGASLSGGRGTIVGTLVGALFLTMITNGLALNGVGASGQLLMVGTIIIAAVAIDNLSTRRLGQGTQF